MVKVHNTRMKMQRRGASDGIFLDLQDLFGIPGPRATAVRKGRMKPVARSSARPEAGPSPDIIWDTPAILYRARRLFWLLGFDTTRQVNPAVAEMIIVQRHGAGGTAFAASIIKIAGPGANAAKVDAAIIRKISSPK